MLATCLGDDSRLIRRAFLDILGAPPTIEEIEWYTTYNTNDGYKLAVDWLLTRVNHIELQEKFLSAEYKTAEQTPLPDKLLSKIIRYQAGAPFVSDDQAIIQLAKLGIKTEQTPTDTIDMFALCLMARVTHVEEINLLMKVFKSYKNELDGYCEVIRLMKDFKDFKNK